MLLKNYWYIAATTPEIQAQPVARELQGQRVVLFRDASGGIKALEDRCAHRNMPLSRGTVVGGQIECAHHGWRYEGTGTCAHVPSLGASARLPRLCVKSYETCESDGYVWVYLGAGPPVDPPFRFPYSGVSGWTTVRLKTRFTGSVENCLEHFLGRPQTASRRGWLRSKATREVRAVTRQLDNEVEIEFQEQPIDRSLAFRLLAPGATTIRRTDRFIMPNVSRVDYAFGPRHDFVITSVCTPIRDDETEVHTVVTYRFGRLAPLMRLAVKPICRRIIRRDVDVMRAQADQIRHFGGAEFRHIETDLFGLRIQAMRRRAAHPGLPYQVRDSDREIRIRF